MKGLQSFKRNVSVVKDLGSNKKKIHQTLLCKRIHGSNFVSLLRVFSRGFGGYQISIYRGSSPERMVGFCSKLEDPEKIFLP